MNISEAENHAVLSAIARASGGQGDWTDVAAVIRESITPEKVGAWRFLAQSRGYLEYYVGKMNVARITEAGNAALADYQKGLVDVR